MKNHHKFLCNANGLVVNQVHLEPQLDTWGI